MNGEITETFSQLVNPGRNILPRIVRITHITDAMVADQPGPEEAARRVGIRLENPFFDTYRFARTLKETQGWENVKLEYLSEILGIAQPDAHRAWCDAQANAQLYVKLRELARQRKAVP